VIFLVGPGNLRSQRAVEKIGAVRAGSRRDAGGRESYLYELTAPRFAQATPAPSPPPKPLQPTNGAEAE
jgi:RimJ/RimL family protein N-acetyltransferase